MSELKPINFEPFLPENSTPRQRILRATASGVHYPFHKRTRRRVKGVARNAALTYSRPPTREIAQSASCSVASIASEFDGVAGVEESLIHEVRMHTHKILGELALLNRVGGYSEENIAESLPLSVLHDRRNSNTNFWLLATVIDAPRNYEEPPEDTSSDQLESFFATFGVINDAATYIGKLGVLSMDWRIAGVSDDVVDIIERATRATTGEQLV